MKLIKRILAIVLSVAVAIPLVAFEAPVEVYAAKTKTITLVKGEKMNITPDYNNVKSVTSSNKSVVTAKKNPDESTEFILTAKGKGTSTVTVKTERGTKKYKIKVVANSIKIKAIAKTDKYLIYRIKNNTSVTFENFAFDWVAKDSDGDVVETGTHIVQNLIAKTTAYASVYIGNDNGVNVKKSAATADLLYYDRSPQYAYTDQTSKVKVTVTPEETEDDIYLKVKFKSKTNEYVDVVADIILYDCDNKIIYVDSVSQYLRKKETSTDWGYAFGVADIYDHYEIVIRACSSSYDYSF
jgi:hypothetical protein